MELFITLVYYFKEIISPNLDLFYFLIIPFLLYDFAKDMGKAFRRAFVTWLPLLLYGIYQVAFFDHIDSTKVYVNLAKIFVCIFLMFFVKENAVRFNFNSFIRNISYLLILSIPVALLFRSPPLWRTNDTINKYVLTRLQLLYVEPSALSAYVCIILVFVIYQIMKGDTPLAGSIPLGPKECPLLKERGDTPLAGSIPLGPKECPLLKRGLNLKESIFFLISLLFIVYLSAGMNGMICLSISCVVMLLVYYYRRSKTFVISLAGILLVGGMIFYILAVTNNPIYLRVQAVMAGDDSSALYRLNIGYAVMKNALINTNGAGVGFGNVNTDFFHSIYSQYGLATIIANSYMYFITEGGVFSFVYLIILLIGVFKCSIRNRDTILYKLPLFIFVLIYQIPGGYFTNPIFWLVYGFICSNACLEEKRASTSPGFVHESLIMGSSLNHDS